MTAKVHESFTDELRHRLENLHERTALLDAGIVDDDGHLMRGDRKEEPMSAEFIDTVISDYENRERNPAQRRYLR